MASKDWTREIERLNKAAALVATARANLESAQAGGTPPKRVNVGALRKAATLCERVAHAIEDARG